MRRLSRELRKFGAKIEKKELIGMLEEALDVSIDPDTVYITTEATPAICPWVPVKIEFRVYKRYVD